MAKEYIEREAALIEIGDADDTMDAELRVWAIPAADVVSVVRCKDCIHRPSRTGDYVEFPDKVCPCQCLEDPWYSWRPPDDWYCADGERKEGGKDE